MIKTVKYSLLVYLCLINSIQLKSLNYGDSLVLNPITFQSPSPVGWLSQYELYINFPELNAGPWQSIYMIQKLKCDSRTKADKYNCGEWDYVWDAILVHSDDTLNSLKLGSFITPYGKELRMGGDQGWEWSYDITDYAPYLVDNKKIIIGNNQELLDLKFIFIKGLPPRNVLSVKNIFPIGQDDGHYGEVFPYEYLSNDSLLREIEVDLDPYGSGYSIKTIISGHGHEGAKNCCEWTSKNHSYIINGIEAFSWDVWKDCGENPIFPQGGTWPYDRAGWCPGTKVDENIFEITDIVVPGTTISIDYRIDKMKDILEGKGVFRMAHQLFSYDKPNFSRNIAVVDIINPSSQDSYSRINPSLSNPKIKIRNNGSTTVKKMKVFYGLVGNDPSIFNWEGKLEFLEEELITLPLPNWDSLTRNNKFSVRVISPNGRKDEYIYDNKMISDFNSPEILDNYFSIHFKTNNLDRAKENSTILKDNYGNILFEKNDFLDNHDYSMIFDLKNGFYEFILYDEKQNGIDQLWWQSSDLVGTKGSLNFLNSIGETTHVFTPDFGESLRFYFHVGDLP